ncbi:uncharacterized protein [Paramormyrops kingsleyae]|uniref:uncharacterized protein n=1 Tax=Paramormyrops kingsleyae TaxID=1676925 RepID=UPI000CD6266C|nr:tumor necrosis factor receptor superfamily member EDAR-like [Paramormyrops kingsleyae]
MRVFLSSPAPWVGSAPMNLGVFVVLLMAGHALGVAESGCDQAQFLHASGTCMDCPTCGPGQQLSEDCGYGDGGGGHCEACDEGEFSADTGLAPCWQCTECTLLNRMEQKPCTPTSNAVCGPCLKGFYELKRKNRVMEPLCMPCLSAFGGVRRDCLPPAPRADTAGVEPVAASVAVIGSSSAATAFFLVLLLWVLLLTVERLNKRFKLVSRPRGLNAGSLRTLLPCAMPRTTPSATPVACGMTEEELEQQNPCDTSRRTLLNQEEDVHTPAIVINVTTNIKPVSQGQGEDCEWERPEESPWCLKEMQKKLQEISAMTAGQMLEELDYDTVHEMSLLIDAGRRRSGLRRLGRALGVSPEVLANVCGFQELFQYLSTSTSTLLPQLAEAIASLPRPDLVARMHQCLLARNGLQPQGVQDGGSPPPKDEGVLGPSALTRPPDT